MDLRYIIRATWHPVRHHLRHRWSWRSHRWFCPWCPGLVIAGSWRFFFPVAVGSALLKDGFMILGTDWQALSGLFLHFFNLTNLAKKQPSAYQNRWGPNFLQKFQLIKVYCFFNVTASYKFLSYLRKIFALIRCNKLPKKFFLEERRFLPKIQHF